MSHTIQEKQKLLNRVRRIKGQVEAIERALEDERCCNEILRLITSGRGAMNARSCPGFTSTSCVRICVSRT